MLLQHTRLVVRSQQCDAQNGPWRPGPAPGRPCRRCIPSQRSLAVQVGAGRRSLFWGLVQTLQSVRTPFPFGHHASPCVIQASQKNPESTVSQPASPAASSSALASARGPSQQQDARGSGVLQQNPSLLRRVLSSSSAADAYELLLQQQQQQQQPVGVSAADVELLIRCSLEAGNVELALSVYQQIRAAKRAQAAGGAAATAASAWPAATLQHTEALVRGLCKQLRVNDALAVLRGIRAQGVSGTDEVRQQQHCCLVDYRAPALLTMPSRGGVGARVSV